MRVAIDPEDMEIRGFDEARGVSFGVLLHGREQEVSSVKRKRVNMYFIGIKIRKIIYRITIGFIRC